jgi:hypothetical protein
VQVVPSLRRWVGRRLRAVLGAYTRLTVESEGVDEVTQALSSPALPERVAMPGSEPSSGDVDEHQP